MRIEPVNNTTYVTDAQRSVKDKSAKINTTDSFQKSVSPEPSMKNLAGVLFGTGGELAKTMKSTDSVVMESTLNKNDKMTIRTLTIPKRDGQRLGHLLCLSDGTLAGIKSRDLGSSGKQEFSVVFMKSNLGEKAEVALQTDVQGETSLISTPDGRVLARDGDEWRCFSSDGKELWKTPYTDMGNFGKSLVVANDGTVINWTKNEKEPEEGRFNVSAISPDGSKKWEKSLKLGVQTVDVNGNVYRSFPDGTSYTKIDSDGNEAEILYSKGDIPTSAKVHNMEVTDSGKVIMQMKMEVPSSGVGMKTVYPKFMVQPGKKPVPMMSESFGTIGGIIDGPDGSTIGVAVKGNSHSELIAYDKDGKMAWRKELPLSNLQNKPFVDNYGRIFVMTNSSQRPPNMLSGSPPAEASLTCYDKQGNKLWEHGMKDNLHAEQAVVFPNGSITISDPYSGKLITLKPGVDVGEDFVQDVLNQALEDDKAKKEQAGEKIQRSTDGKSISIGGVKIPVRQYRFMS